MLHRPGHPARLVACPTLSADRPHPAALRKGCEDITPQAVQGMIELAASEMSPDAPVGDRAFFESTLRHVRLQKAKEGEVAARYEGVVIPGTA